MNISKQTLFIAIGAFILGIIFSLSLVIVSLWSYKLGRSDYKDVSVKDIELKTPSPQIIPSITPEVEPVYPTQIPEPTSVPVYTPVAISTEPVNINNGGNGEDDSGADNSDGIDQAEREKVMNYMYSVNNILLSNKKWSDPNQFANQLITSTLNGDTSGLDSLINDYNNINQQLMTLRPPTKDCREYHEGCVELISEGASMLGSVKQGIETQDINTLLSLQSQATSMEETAREVDNLGKEIYKKYNIPEPSD